MITIDSISTRVFSETTTQLVAVIFVDDKQEVLTYEVENEFAQYLTTERSDAFIWLCLPIAMRNKHDITSKIPMTEQFKYNLEEYFIPSLADSDKLLYQTKIISETSSEEVGGSAVGTANSLGVDSMYTIKQHTDKRFPNLQLTHLYIGNLSADLWNAKVNNLEEYLLARKELFDKQQRVADELGLPFIKSYSNSFEFIHKYIGKGDEFIHITYDIYLTIADVLCLKKLWKTYLFSSGYTFSGISIADTSKNSTATYELLQVHALTVPDFSIYAAGGAVTRNQKTRRLYDYGLARKYLSPCFRVDGTNCSMPQCTKCLRFLTLADVDDRLDDFREVFDIERYKESRVEYIIALYIGLQNRHLRTLNLGIIEELEQKYPELSEKAKRISEQRTSPVPHAEFNKVLKYYLMLTRMIEKGNPSDIVNNFFETKNLHSVFIVGESPVGNTVKAMMTPRLQLVNNPKAADSFLIVSTDNFLINSQKKQFVDTFVGKRVFTLDDLIWWTNNRA